MRPASIDRPRLLLLGGGHSQVEVLRQLAHNPLEGIGILLISRAVHSLYSGMLPGLVAGHYQREQCHIHLPSLADAAGAEFLQAEVTGIDANNNTVCCDDGTDQSFDFLSVNTGSVPATVDPVPGDAQNLKVKPVGAFVDQWSVLQQAMNDAERPLRIAVIGGGAGGVELILAMQYRNAQAQKQDNRVSRHHFHLFTDAPQVLPAFNRRVRARIGHILLERGIHLHTNRFVEKVTERALLCADKSQHDADHVLWVTQAAAPAWTRQSKLATDTNGFIRVNDSLQSVSHPHVFAAGDVAALPGSPLQKSGVVAVRQGPVLARNLQHVIRGKPLEIFKPQKHFLALISCGEKYAVASRGDFYAGGRWLWYLKDYIDRRFIRKYNRYRKTQSAEKP